MAYEELKALYEIDKQHSDTPWEFWELRLTRGPRQDVWDACSHEPRWPPAPKFEYRRKPDAPVWPSSDDAEDARKWRELEAFYQSNGIMDTAKKFLEIIEPKPALIQGYTAEQWQTIIDGKFLCEFADYNFPKSPIISALHSRKDSGFCFEDEDGEKGAVFKNCRPLRTKGVRQPWFGGGCPVSPQAKVIVKFSDGSDRVNCAGNFVWGNLELSAQIVEFIEL